MDWLLYAVIIFVACLYIVPKTIIFVLCIVLRKFSFYASVGGPLTLNGVMLRIPLKMNFSILIRIEQIRIQISLMSLLGILQSQEKLIGVRSYGLQVNLLLRDDFDKWNDSKIELLYVIEQFRMKLSRLGLLNDHSVGPAKTTDEVEEKKPIQDANAKDWSETIKNLLDASNIGAQDTQVNFFVYKMDGLDEFHRNIDEVNVQMFYERCIQSREFQRKYNCARFFLQTAQANFLRLNEDAFEIMVTSPQLLVLNSKFNNEQGQLSDVEVVLNVPRSLELLKDFCHWELSIKIQSGKFDISKGFIKSTLSFFIMMDTLASIFKEITNLVYKQHFQDIMFFKSGFQQRQGNERIYDNYRDVDIPKKIKLTIVDSLEVEIAYPSQRLGCFLAKDRLENSAELQQGFLPEERLKIVLAPKTTFEMTFRINKTYYLQFATPRIDLEVNGKTCASLENFQLQVSFVFKREQTNFKIKQCPLELTLNINAESLSAKQSPAFMKHILELVNYYMYGVSLASVKHKIFAQIQDPTFLIENIIERKNSKEMSRPRYTTEQYRELYEVLEIYEFETHLDKITTVINIQKVHMDHSSRDIYGSSFENDGFRDLPGSFAADFSLSMQNFHFSIGKVGPTEEMVLKCATLCLGQQNRMSDSQRSQYKMPALMPKDQRPLAKASALCFQKFLKLRFAGSSDPTLPMSDRENYKIYNMRFFAEGLQINVDLEFILDRTRDILDYSFVCKHFSRKWTFKYVDLTSKKTKPLKKSDLQVNHQQRQRVRVRPRNCTWREVTESISFYMPMAEVIWNISRSRMVILHLEEFRPFGQAPQCFERMRLASLANDVNRNRHEFTNINQKRHTMTAFDTTQFEFISSKAAIYHCKPEQGEVGQGDPIEILSAKDFKLGLSFSEKLIVIGFGLKKLGCHLPHKVLLGPLINEIDKQISHVPNWIRQQYKNRKRDVNFQYQEARIASQEVPMRRINLQFEQKADEPVRKTKKPWRIDLDIDEIVIGLEDDPLLQLFTNQNEIVEMLTQRQVFACEPRSLLNLLKNLKKSGIYRKYCEIRANKLTGRIEMPERFNDPSYCLKWVRSLDEAHMYAQPNFFDVFDVFVVKINTEYLAIHARSIFKPVIEVWNFDIKSELMNVQLNSNLNPQLFKTDVIDRIFNRFPLLRNYNKLPNRFHYMVQLEVHKINFCIQGQQTFLFFNDFGQNIKKLSGIEDLSKSLDTRIKKLPVLGGSWNQIRKIRRGSAQIKINDFEIEVWPKRNFNRFSDRLLISFNDFQYHQRVTQSQQERVVYRMQHEFYLRSLIFRKEPLKQTESALVNFPLIELQVLTNYNQGRDVDYYQILKARDYDEYVQLLKIQSTKELAVQFKLNIPSFGTINPAREKCPYLPKLMQFYLMDSPIPIVHYQRSQMKFIDEILQEYVNGGKIDISDSVKTYKARIQSQKGQNCDARSPKLPFDAGESVNNTFCLQVQAYLNDMMVLFTDFDETQEEFRMIDDEKLTHQTMEREQVDEDEKRDDYLSNYQGIVFSTENLSLATTIIFDITNEAQKFKADNSFFKNKFLCLSALNSANLFQIRNKKLDNLRRQEYPNSMDNYNYFCRFFGLDQQSVSYGKLTHNFKTLFPAYVLNNETIQHAITTATGGYESFTDSTKHQKTNPMEYLHRSASIFGEGNFQSIEEDLNFRECDILAMIELMEYQQDQLISYQGSKKDFENDSYNSSGQPLDTIRGGTTPSNFKNQAKQQSAKSSESRAQKFLKKGTLSLYHQDAEVQSKIKVSHLLDVKNTRFLYTKRIFELLHHHLVQGFNYKKYRKTDYIDVEQKLAKKRNFLDGYNDSEANYLSKEAEMEKKQAYMTMSAAAKQKEFQKQAYIGVRFINPQISLQDDILKAQALIASEGSATAVLFAYSDSPNASTGFGAVEIQKTKSDGRWNTNIVKYEICIKLDQMNLYVAPTYINLEKPTFWKSNNSRKIDEVKRPNSAKRTQPRDADETLEVENTPRSKSPNQDSENINALRKVLSFTQVNLKYIFLEERGSAYEPQNPTLDIDFQLSRVVCEMDGPSMWQFLGVFKRTFLDRGEKSIDTLLIEEARAKDLKQFKPDQLREMIDREVKGSMGSLLNQMKPIFVKRVSYSVEQCEFSFFNNYTKFASGTVEQLKGMHWIYANKESKTDIDVEKISLSNHLEEEKQEVLQPYGQRDSSQHLREAMIKLRTRDKFVVVSQSPWRVFDQFEIFIYPTNIQLTREFYSNIKQFFFTNMSSDPVNQPDELQDHYDTLISSKALQKAMPAAVKSRDTVHKMMMDNLSDKSNNQKKKKLSFAETGHSTLEKTKSSTAGGEKQQVFQSFFRYLRINEIQVQITYLHSKNSRLNVHNMRLRLQPFIMHGKFQTMQQVVVDYEKHCKKKVLAQTPNLLTQFMFQAKEKVTEVFKDQDERKDEMQLHLAKRLLFGDFAGA